MDKLSSSPQARIASFALALGLAFVLAFALGSAFDPADTDAGAEHGEATHDGPAAPHQRETGEANEHSEHPPAIATTTPGLAVSEDGYSLRLAPAFLTAGKPRELRFRIVDAGGATVEDFDQLHEREMHLIVVRRDGAHFQHLHPEIDATGTWAVALSLPAAGVYRAFADFSVAGAPHTLAADLFAPGRFEPRPFPASTPVDAVDGYEVRLADATLEAGEPAALRFLVTKAGIAVAGIESYLGARGHLVALREGDLAFLHAHPEAGAAPSVIPYGATFPSAGRYRLFLQFKHAGQVRTAQFTVAVSG